MSIVCPFCGYNHGPTSGKLNRVTPIFGGKKQSGEGIDSHWSDPGYKMPKSRFEEIRTGSVWQCLAHNCGHQFGCNADGPFKLPEAKPQPAAKRNGPAPEDRTEPMRPAHYVDEDAAAEPNFG